MSSTGILDDFPLPMGVDFEKWKFLVKGLRRLNANNQPVSSEQLYTLTKIAIALISGNIKFLKKLDIITPESKGSQIQFSSNGILYSDALMIQDATKTKEILSNLIKIQLKELVDFCELHKQSSDLTFDMIFNHLKLVSNTPDTLGKTRNTHPSYRLGIHTVIEMLIYAGILDETYLAANNKASPDKIDGISTVRAHSEIPLYGSSDWLEKLFNAIKTVNPQQITKNFVTVNVAKHNAEHKVLTIARFLGMIDKEGNHAENYDRLRIFGTDEFEQNLTDIIKNKYSKILNITNLETVERSNLVSAIMKEYEMGADRAEKSIDVLINLCKMANMPLSDSLTKKKYQDRKVNGEQPVKQSVKQSIKGTSPLIGRIPTQQYPMSIENSNFGFKIEIKINADAKDKESLQNIKNFINELRNMPSSTISELAIAVNEEPKLED